MVRIVVGILVGVLGSFLVFVTFSPQPKNVFVCSESRRNSEKELAIASSQVVEEISQGSKQVKVMVGDTCISFAPPTNFNEVCSQMQITGDSLLVNSVNAGPDILVLNDSDKRCN